MDILLTSIWALTLAAHVGIMALLYRLGNQRFSAGYIWGLLGFCFGLLAVAAFFLFVVRAEAMERTTARSEFGRIKGVLKHHRDTADEYRAAITTNMDPEVDLLLSRQQYDEAETYVNEKLRGAYEMGNTEREEMYRRYLEIIAGWNEREGHG